MKFLILFAATSVGSYVGWWLGGMVGFVTACYLSVVGTGVGLYAGRVLIKKYDENYGD